MFSMLLLDDEPDVLSSLRRALREPLGDEVTMHAFTDPYAALAHMDEHSVDLVMTDYRMSPMSGTQFLHFVRGLQPLAQRIIVSATTDVNAVISAINEVDVASGALTERDAEARRLYELEPGLTRVQCGPNGEVLMPPLPRRMH